MLSVTVTVTVTGYLFSFSVFQVAGFAEILSERGVLELSGELRTTDTSALCPVYAGMLSEQELGLVVLKYIFRDRDNDSQVSPANISMDKDQDCVCSFKRGFCRFPKSVPHSSV